MVVVAFARAQVRREPIRDEPPGLMRDEKWLRIYGRVLSILFALLLALHIGLVSGCIATLFLHFRSVIVSGYYNGYITFYFWSPLDQFNPNLVGSRFHPFNFGPREATLEAISQVLGSMPITVFLGSLVRLFSLYARGVVFDRANTTALRWAGHSMSAYGLTGIVFAPVMRLLGLSPRWIVLTDSEFREIFFGLTIFAVAHVMEIGRRIQHDHNEIL